MCRTAGSRVRVSLAMLSVLCGSYALQGARTPASPGVLASVSQSRSGEAVVTPLATVVNGRVEIAGEPGRFHYDFDHNALSDAVRVGDALIALTASGNLLRFDTSSMTMTTQAVVPGRGTAIAKDYRDTILLGTEDGGIFSVDSDTLVSAPIAHVDGAVGWLHRDAARLVAAVLARPLDWWPGEDIKSWERRSRSRPRPWILVRTGDRMTRYPIPHAAFPNAFAVSGTTLWLGVDRGEFGGELNWLDLANGRSGSAPVDNVLGLVPTSDGRLIAFGGLVHLTVSRGFVAEVDRTGAHPIRNSDSLGRGSGAGIASAETSAPAAPIDDVEEDTIDGGFWILSDHSVYHASADFTRWSAPVGLNARFIGGRRFSAGDTPSITRLVPGKRAGDVVALSALDGAWHLSASGIRHIAFGEQLARAVVDIWPLSNGTLFLSGSNARSQPVSAWHVTDGRWTETPLCPEDSSRKGYAITDTDGGVLAYCEGYVTPGPVGIARVDASAPAVMVDSWESAERPAPEWFLRGADGQVFGLAASTLWIRDARSWRDVGTAAVSGTVLNGPFGRPFVPLAAGQDGRFVQWAADLGTIVMLTRRPAERWRLEEIHQSRFSHVLDATPDDGAGAFIATPAGVFRYRIGSDRVVRLPAIPEDSIVSVARDSDGRLWAAGDRLHVSRDDAKTWSTVDLPMISRTRLKRVRRNPSARGVIISLYDRGMLTIE